ncbi:MAG TPA: hypothetical protein VFP72_16575 [Kineosporiaceae bacterium]|nr:hypothetical protein [Kineosporiaceae bacterium]
MTGRPGEVYRVEWVPGTDHLLGTCFCRAQHLDVDPISLWEWLYGHPHGHDLLPAAPAPDELTEVPA